jgi:hypothetical protein
MAHVRTQIRQAFKDALIDALDDDYDVFASRKYKLNMVERPMIDMRFNSVDINAQTMGDLRTHSGRLFIRVQRMATGDDMDDLLDQDEVNVTAAIEAVNWSSLLEEEPELKEVSWADDAEGEVPIGMIVLRYDIEYRIAKNDPETMRS